MMASARADPGQKAQAAQDEVAYMAEMDRLMTRIRAVEAQLLLTAERGGGRRRSSARLLVLPLARRGLEGCELPCGNGLLLWPTLDPIAGRLRRPVRLERARGLPPKLPEPVLGLLSVLVRAYSSSGFYSGRSDLCGALRRHHGQAWARPGRDMQLRKGMPSAVQARGGLSGPKG